MDIFEVVGLVALCAMSLRIVGSLVAGAVTLAQANGDYVDEKDGIANFLTWVGSSNGGIHPIRASATGTVRILFVDQEPDVGWHRDPDESAVYRFWKSGEWREASKTYRYWNGSEWTFRAGADSETNVVIASGHRQGRRVLDSWLFSNPISFHILAWFDCSVPLTRGRLRRFTMPIELRTLDQVRRQQ